MNKDQIIAKYEDIDGIYRDFATSLSAFSKDMDREISAMCGIIDDLRANWTQALGDRFVRSFNEKQSKFEDCNDRVKKLKTEIDVSAKKVADALDILRKA